MLTPGGRLASRRLANRRLASRSTARGPAARIVLVCALLARELLAGLPPERLLLARKLPAHCANPARSAACGIVERNSDPAGQTGGEFSGLPGRPVLPGTADGQQPERPVSGIEREAPHVIRR
jgi:hypothetical protein